ncbi:hypothetical protein Q3G72_011650 [Acer saccharum]|nr:hypothetical protein Q3G72_011105 [Acer saccharum]KAK1567398.1 hypothetical protein Q3G72_011650 [Acer saccharum]
MIYLAFVMIHEQRISSLSSSSSSTSSASPIRRRRPFSGSSSPSLLRHLLRFVIAVNDDGGSCFLFQTVKMN